MGLGNTVLLCVHEEKCLSVMAEVATSFWIRALSSREVGCCL